MRATPRAATTNDRAITLGALLFANLYAVHSLRYFLRDRLKQLGEHVETSCRQTEQKTHDKQEAKQARHRTTLWKPIGDEPSCRHYDLERAEAKRRRTVAMCRRWSTAS